MSTRNPRDKATGVCPQCAQEVEIGTLVGAKIGGATLGAFVGDRTTDHWLGALVGGAIGHVIDKAVLPSRPMCRVALEVANAMT
jgi:outer membrane lipoprotein SlyB